MRNLKENVDTIYGIITNKVSLIGNYGNVKNNKVMLSNIIPKGVYKCIGIDFNTKVYNVTDSNEKITYYTGEDVSLEEMIETLSFLEGNEDNISISDFDEINPYIRNLHLDDEFVFEGNNEEFSISVKDCIEMFSFANTQENTSKFPLANVLNCNEIQKYLVDMMDKSDKSMRTVKAYNVNGKNLSVIPVITSSADLTYQEDIQDFINDDKVISKAKKDKKRYLDYYNKYKDSQINEFNKHKSEDLKKKVDREKKRLEKNPYSSFTKKKKYRYHKVGKDAEGNKIFIRK